MMINTSNRRRIVCGLAVLVCGLAPGGGCREESQETPSATPSAPEPTPNVIIILIDAMRADVLGTYGNPRDITPTLDSIAAESVTFDRVISAAPWTQPSIASLFCSRYPGVHGVLDYVVPLGVIYEKNQPMVTVFADSFDTLAEAFQAGGYLTAGFVANPFIKKGFGFAQGFDHFDSSFAKSTTTGDVVNAAAIAWLKQRDPTAPFFLYLHYMDVHGPYEARPEFLDPLLEKVDRLPNKRRLTEKEIESLDYLWRPPTVYTDRDRHVRLRPYQEYWVARYEAGVRQADHYVGELRTELISLGLWNDAYVIVTSDHGEALREHGFSDHGFSVHHTDLHVPLILRWPGVLPAGRRIAHPVRLIDLMPTLLDQLRLPQLDGMQGRSLTPDLAGRPPSAPVPAFAEGVKMGPEQKAVHLGDWKLMITEPHGDRKATRQLYNLTIDHLEQTELSAQHAAKTESLTGLLARQVQENARLAADVEVKRVPLSPAELERLRSLGYID